MLPRCFGEGDLQQPELRDGIVSLVFQAINVKMSCDLTLPPFFLVLVLDRYLSGTRLNMTIPSQLGELRYLRQL
jgi:hypothetical protein